jgi:hypothetical protein
MMVDAKKSSLKKNSMPCLGGVLVLSPKEMELQI